MAMTTVQAHGGLREAELRELGLRPDEVIDFSASVTPLGASPKAVAALRQVDYSRYPDPDCTRLREAIAAHHGVTPAEVLPGNGATELIHLVVRLFVRRGQRPIVFMPTFGEFERACQTVNATPYPWHANPARGFRWNFANKAARPRRGQPRGAVWGAPGELAPRRPGAARRPGGAGPPAPRGGGGPPGGAGGGHRPGGGG